MRDSRRALERVQDGSREAGEERLGGMRQSRSSLIMLYAVYQHLEQLFNAVGESKMAHDTGYFGEHNILIMLCETHANVRLHSTFERSSGLADDIARFQKHD